MIISPKFCRPSTGSCRHLCAVLFLLIYSETIQYDTTQSDETQHDTIQFDTIYNDKQQISETTQLVQHLTRAELLEGNQQPLSGL